MNFTKMHGLQNDFLIIADLEQRIQPNTYAELAKNICNRHTGVGADGLILVLPSKIADIQMLIINSDGSTTEMCGNGIRCFAQYVYDHAYVSHKTFTVETGAGIKTPTILPSGNIQVDMGEPVINPTPVTLFNFPLTEISMGNPHAVTFVDDITKIDLDTVGPKFEHHSHFPNGTNTEFVQILSPTEAKLIVWERGAGKTMACGTGACASLVAGVLAGHLNRHATIHLPGGPLDINWQDNNRILMTGPASYICDGTLITP